MRNKSPSMVAGEREKHSKKLDTVVVLCSAYLCDTLGLSLTSQILYCTGN